MWGVLWDLDGVLIDSAPWHLASWQWLAQQYGRTFPVSLFQETFGLPNGAILRRLFPDRDLTDEDIRRLSEQKEAMYRTLVRAHLTWCPGAVELLEDLRRHGARQGLFTSTPRSNVVFIDEVLGLSRYLEVILTGDDVPRGKPAPDGYAVLCRRLGLSPDRAVVIEDAPAGIEAAHAAGLRCIAVATTHPPERLGSADWVVRDLTELSAHSIQAWLGA